MVLRRSRRVVALLYIDRCLRMVRGSKLAWAQFKRASDCVQLHNGCLAAADGLGRPMELANFLFTWRRDREQRRRRL